MIKRRTGREGMTLLEVVVGSAIFAAMIGIAMMLLKSGQDAYSAGVVVSNLRQKATSTLDRMAVELRLAGVSTVGVYDGGTLTNTTGDRADFKKAVGSDGFEPIWGNTISFRLNGDRVERLELDDGGNVISQGAITSRASELYFERSTVGAGADRLTIRVTLVVPQVGGTRKPYTATAETTVTFRI